MARFEKDLFISYAHIDNEPLSPEQQGWISRFHGSLEALLSMRLGQRAKIWRDPKLQGNDIFADTILEMLERSAVLVSILTPRYINSNWCTREVREFCERAEQGEGVVVDHKARVFKVLKTPVETEASLPEIIKNVLGYEFFTLEDGAPLELDPAYGETFAQDYNRKVSKLAWEIAQLLKKLDGGGTATALTGKSLVNDKPTVYLAECSYDRRREREMLEADLKLHGYPILPDQALPQEETKYLSAVEGLLDRCRLSVHLVGKSYGAVPDGPRQQSVVMLQNELAVQHSKQGRLSRVIWLPDNTPAEQASQQAFIDALRRDAEAQFGADVVTGDFEQLKTTLHCTLEKLSKKEPPAELAATAEESPLLYVVCDEKDRKATIPLRKFLRNHGCDVAIPVFEGDAGGVREANEKLMSSCDAILIYYGAGDTAWKRTIDAELKKMKGYRGSKRLLGCFTYLAPPMTGDKEDLIDLDEPNLINGIGEFPESEMTACVQAVQLKEPPHES